jgi:CDP-paratose 2-epimerase
LEAARDFLEAPLLTSTNVFTATPGTACRCVNIEAMKSSPHMGDRDLQIMSIDYSKHSSSGHRKLRRSSGAGIWTLFRHADCFFRGGCLTGPAHAGTELHGFLSYLMICAVKNRPYRVFGYKGKQVRDNIHSFDLVEAFAEFIRAPRAGEVYNIGGSRHSNCSMLEAIDLCEEISGRKLTWSYEETNRIGDHIWWISDVRKFQKHYPGWKFQYSLREILDEIHRSVAYLAE